METELYIGMVRQLGIEEAYKQRHRATGRTIRNVLELVLLLSRGETVEIHTSATPGKTRSHTMMVMCKIIEVCHILGMNEIDTTGDKISYPPSGGSVRVVSGSANRRGERIPHEMQIYELHE